MNAALPIPTVTLLVMGHPIALPFFAFTLTIHGLLLWGIMHARCQWLGPLTQSFRAEQKAVWLTIDDGPDGERSLALSNELRSRGVRATFFVIGERLNAQPEIGRALVADGHTLANHTLRHPRETFWCSPRPRVRAEVDGGAAALRALGVEPTWFRAPVGHKPPSLRRILEERGMRLISWTVGGRDGWVSDPSGTVERVMNHARPGAIIVLHECRAHSHSTILAVVDALLAQGFAFCIPTEAMFGGAVVPLSNVRA